MIVLTLGTFDLFHEGHVNLLRRCREAAGPYGLVTVGLNTDGFIQRYKGHLPVIGYEQRAAVLRACRYVDNVLPNDQAHGSARDVISASGATVLVVGDDWQQRDYAAQLGVTTDWLNSIGCEVRYVPYTQGISTTAIRRRLA